MPAEIYRYTFDPEVSLEEVQASLLLALFAVESLHGKAQVRLDAGHAFDAEQRRFVVDAQNSSGSRSQSCVRRFLTP